MYLFEIDRLDERVSCWVDACFALLLALSVCSLRVSLVFSLAPLGPLGCFASAAALLPHVDSGLLLPADLPVLALPLCVLG